MKGAALGKTRRPRTPPLLATTGQPTSAERPSPPSRPDPREQERVRNSCLLRMPRRLCKVRSVETVVASDRHLKRSARIVGTGAHDRSAAEAIIREWTVDLPC